MVYSGGTVRVAAERIAASVVRPAMVSQCLSRCQTHLEYFLSGMEYFCVHIWCKIHQSSILSHPVSPDTMERY